MLDVDLATTTDQELWEFAGRHDLIIVSKDSDFSQLAFLHGPPPKSLWLRVGNVATSRIEDLLRASVSTIERFVDDEAEALLVLEFAAA